MSCVPLFSDSVWANFGYTGRDAYELRKLSEDRTEKFDGEYVRQVCRIWDEAKARPPHAAAAVLESHWVIGGKGVVCRSLAHEYYFTLLRWVLEEKKDLNRACRIVQWRMMPCALLVKSSPVFFLSEPGCRQLLCWTLCRFMAGLIDLSEAMGSTEGVFCGMIRWTLDQCHLLARLRSPFAEQARALALRLRPLLLLYVKPDDADHDIALAMAAMNAFLALRDTARYEKARARVPPTSVLAPTDRHRPVPPVGPSSVSSLNKRWIQ